MNQQYEPRYLQESDADLSVLESRNVVIVGYGNLGRPLALNLRDSGVSSVTVAEIPGPAWEVALEDGFPVKPVQAAAPHGSILFVLLSDELAPEIYQKEIAPFLKPGSTVVFASGFNLAFGKICPALDLDVLMVAPRMIGSGIREM